LKGERRRKTNPLSLKRKSPWFPGGAEPTFLIAEACASDGIEDLFYQLFRRVTLFFANAFNNKSAIVTKVDIVSVNIRIWGIERFIYLTTFILGNL